MDWITIVKYLHVVSAVCWIGGNAVLLVSGIIADVRKDEQGAANVLKLTVALSPVFFIPSSLLTLAFGLIMAFNGNLWSEGWIILGLLGFLTTFCIGLFILKPTSERFTANHEAGRAVEARADAARMSMVAKFDNVLLFSVIFDMVVRPAWSDYLPLAIIGIAIVGGAVVFLLPALTTRTAAPA
jgi:uncharacterized membrane protein